MTTDGIRGACDRNDDVPGPHGFAPAEDEQYVRDVLLDLVDEPTRLEELKADLLARFGATAAVPSGRCPVDCDDLAALCIHRPRTRERPRPAVCPAGGRRQGGRPEDEAPHGQDVDGCCWPACGSGPAAQQATHGGCWCGRAGPAVTVRTWTEWQVRSSDEDAIAFASDDRASAEKWLRRLEGERCGEYVLVRVGRRTRTESWRSGPQAVTAVPRGSSRRGSGPSTVRGLSDPDGA